MRRAISAVGCAVCLALLVAGCSGAGPQPTPPPGNGGGGGVVTPPNTAPVIKSLTASDARAEVGIPLTVTAIVEDAETPVANLTYTWTADTGSFTGTGASVTWVAGQEAKTPADVVLKLTVTEKYTNGTVPAENTVTSTATVHLNNSPKELAEMSLRFLTDFGNSSVSADKCVSEFSPTCARDKNDELDDITKDRHDFLHLSSSCRNTGVSLSADRRAATVHTFCSFSVRVITRTPETSGCMSNPSACPFGGEGTAQGDFWTTGVYEGGRWWLCQSHYSPTGTLTPLARAFAGLISDR